ncbi:MAG: hypothetical protein ACI977_000872 [Candidatus Nanohaloarchaea archaeon]|jgi:hypothetical protein
MDQFVWYEVAVGIISIIGMAATLYTAQQFKLRQWKFALYYLASGLGVFSIYQFIQGFHIVESALGLAGFEVLFIAIMTYSIYRLKITAQTIGA